MIKTKQKNRCEFINATFVIAIAAFVISLALVGVLTGPIIKVIRKKSSLLYAKHDFTARIGCMWSPFSNNNSSLVG